MTMKLLEGFQVESHGICRIAPKSYINILAILFINNIYMVCVFMGT